jgi:hypothetical protein
MFDMEDAKLFYETAKCIDVNYVLTQARNIWLRLILFNWRNVIRENI